MTLTGSERKSGTDNQGETEYKVHSDADLELLSLDPFFEREYKLEIGGEQELVRKLPLWAISVAPQMRREFDPTPLAELSESIEKVLLHKPIVFFLNPEQAEFYVANSNKVFGTDVKLEDLPQVLGGYFMLSAGERRVRAAKLVSERREVGLSETAIYCVLHRCDSITEIIELQGAENFHERPSPESFAYRIIWQYKTGLEIGDYDSEEDFLQKISLPDSKIQRRTARDALRYFELPEAVRDAVEIKNTITYGHAVALQAYIDPYVRWHRERNNTPEADIPYLVEMKLLSVVQAIELEGWTVRATRANLESWETDLFNIQRSFEDEFMTAVDSTAQELEDIRLERQNALNEATRSVVRLSGVILEAVRDDGRITDGVRPGVLRGLETMTAMVASLRRSTGDERVIERAAELGEQVDALKLHLFGEEADLDEPDVIN